MEMINVLRVTMNGKTTDGEGDSYAESPTFFFTRICYSGRKYRRKLISFRRSKQDIIYSQENIPPIIDKILAQLINLLSQECVVIIARGIVACFAFKHLISF